MAGERKLLWLQNRNQVFRVALSHFTNKKINFSFVKLQSDLLKHNYNCAVLAIQLICLNITIIVLFDGFYKTKIKSNFFFEISETIIT